MLEENKTDADQNTKEDDSILDPAIEARIEALNLSFVSPDDDEYYNKVSEEAKNTETVKQHPGLDPFSHLDELGLQLVATPKKEKIEEDDDEEELEKKRAKKAKREAERREAEEENKKLPFYQRKMTNDEVIKIVAIMIAILLALRFII